MRLAPRILAASLAALAFAPGAAASACDASEYSYAGVASERRAYGVAARLTALVEPTVVDGHVGAWVGVGGVGLGPDGSDQWIQVGMSAFPGSGVSLYYEIARPGARPEYVEFATGLAAGVEHRVAVVEMKGARDHWRVWADGRPVSEPIHLPQSHGAWEPIATGESWSGGRAVCNGYAFRFSRVRVSVRPGGVWRSLRDAWLLQDPGYRVVRRGRAPAFLALAAG